MNFKTFFILFLLAGMANADCRSNWKVCANYTLPFDTNIVGTQGNLIGLRFDNVLTKNGVHMINANLSNIQVRVFNSTTGGNPTYDTDGQIGCGGGGSVPPCYILLTANQTKDLTANNNPSYVEVCANESYTNGYALTSYIFTDGPIWKYFTDSEMDYAYVRNWTFRNEENNQLFSFTGQNATMTVWCDDYTELNYNLSIAAPSSRMEVVTLQEPKFFVTINKATPRIRQDTDIVLADDFYVFGVNPTEYSDYTFTLQDFTGGQFWGSTLQIQRTINDTLGYVHVEQFPIDSVISTRLQNNTQYRFKVVGSTSTRDLGGIYIKDDNTVRNIVVTRPDFNEFTNKWRNVIISFTQDYASSQVGCVMNSTTTENVVFTVYNITSTDYIYDYNTTADSKNVVSTYTVTDNNGSYYLCCSAYNSIDGLRNKCQVVNIRDTSAIQYGFDLNLPARVLGVSRATVYKLLSIMILVIVAGIFSQQSYGTGGLVTAACLSFFYYIGWFPIPEIMVGFIFTLAIFTKISENRQGVAT